MIVFKKIIKEYFNLIYNELDEYAQNDYHNVVGTFVTTAQFGLIMNLQYSNEKTILNYFKVNPEILGEIINYKPYQVLKLFKRIAIAHKQ